MRKGPCRGVDCVALQHGIGTSAVGHDRQGAEFGHEFAQNFDAALAMGVVLVLFSLILLISLRLILSWQTSFSTRSWFRFGPSTSG